MGGREGKRKWLELEIDGRGTRNGDEEGWVTVFSSGPGRLRSQ